MNTQAPNTVGGITTPIPASAPRPGGPVSPAMAKASAWSWKAMVPVAVALVLALLPAPSGLAQHAWYFFAIFVGVIVGLVLEPLPGAAIALIGLTLITVLARFVLFGPEQSSQAGFRLPNAALT